MNKKSELLLQLFFIFCTVSTFSLILVKLYPETYFTHQKVIAIIQNKKKLTEIIKSKTYQEKEVPELITIPSINIQLLIAPGIIINNDWTLYDDKVTWLSTSNTPGSGNVIVYGHDRKNLFGNLVYIKLGDIIGITTNKKTYIYQVISKQKIKPTDVSQILSDKNQLTLYTCNGYFDQWRLLIKAAYKEII